MKITYHGHSAFRIETGKSVILVDPFFTGNPAATPPGRRRATASPISPHPRPRRPCGRFPRDPEGHRRVLVSSFEVCSWLNAKGAENYSPGNHGGRISFDDFDVIFTNAWHSSSDMVAGSPVYLGNPMGFVIEPRHEQGKTLYIAGDTGIFMTWN